MPGKINKTIDEFKNEFNLVHNFKYNYSKITNEITKLSDEICIICPIHAEFYQKISYHLKGQGCPTCGRLQSNLKRRSNNVKFIEKAVKLKGSQFNYDEVVYIKAKTKIIIKCNTCNYKFEQTPDSHLRGAGCPNCAQNITITEKEFYKRCFNKFGLKFGYNNVKYIDFQKTKINIFCKKHNIYFETRPCDHLSGHGACPKCRYELAAEKRRIDLDQYKKYCTELHNGLYLYDRVSFKILHDKIEIYCTKHNGYFLQTANNHRYGVGCPKCSPTAPIERSDCIKKMNEKYNYFYNYSKVEILNQKIKICIICPLHGEFWQYPAKHLKGTGCQECRKERPFLKHGIINKLIPKFQAIHGTELFDYSHLCDKDYHGTKNLITIKCKKCLKFFQQTPNSHLAGSGCPNCRILVHQSIISKIMETIFNKKFICTKNEEWLINPETGRHLELDVYNSELKIAVEYNGPQHYKNVYNDTEERFQQVLYRDNLKIKLCKENNVKLLIISYKIKPADFFETIIKFCLDKNITLPTDYKSIYIDIPSVKKEILNIE